MSVEQFKFWEEAEADAVDDVCVPGANSRVIGKVGEYIAAIELELAGYPTSFAAEGLPYDLAVQCADGVKRVQVKATSVKHHRHHRQSESWVYRFKAGGGSQSMTKYDGQVDAFALVVLPLRRVMFIDAAQVTSKHNLDLNPSYFKDEDMLFRSMRFAIGEAWGGESAI